MEESKEMREDVGQILNIGRDISQREVGQTIDTLKENNAFKEDANPKKQALIQETESPQTIIKKSPAERIRSIRKKFRKIYRQVVALQRTRSKSLKSKYRRS